MTPDSYFATINGEDYQTRHAREAREEFAKVKEQAYKLKAEASAAVIEAGIALARVKAYEEYVNKNLNPYPYSRFGWEECVLCHKEIRDDPYGHNAAPLADGICCKACNEDVIATRQKSWVMGLIDYMNNHNSDEEEE